MDAEEEIHSNIYLKILMQNDNLLDIGVDVRFILEVNGNNYACVSIIV
jgi:hypothetical protein